MCDVWRLRFQTALRAVYTRRVRPRISYREHPCAFLYVVLVWTTGLDHMTLQLPDAPETTDVIQHVIQITSARPSAMCAVAMTHRPAKALIRIHPSIPHPASLDPRPDRHAQNLHLELCFFEPSQRPLPAGAAASARIAHATLPARDSWLPWGVLEFEIDAAVAKPITCSAAAPRAVAELQIPRCSRLHVQLHPTSKRSTKMLKAKIGGCVGIGSRPPVQCATFAATPLWPPEKGPLLNLIEKFVSS